MSTRFRVVIAVLCAVVAAVSLMFYTQHIHSQSISARDEALKDYGSDTTQIVVASRDIAPGELLNDSNLIYATWVVDLLPRDVVRDIGEISGKTSAGPLVQGQALSMIHVRDASSSTISVPDGYEALSLKLEKSHALSGLIEAGMLVDIYERSTSSSVLMGERIQVLASAQDGSNSVYLTLQVPEEHVVELLQAEQTSDVYITLPASERQ